MPDWSAVKASNYIESSKNQALFLAFFFTESHGFCEDPWIVKASSVKFLKTVLLEIMAMVKASERQPHGNSEALRRIRAIDAVV